MRLAPLLAALVLAVAAAGHANPIPFEFGLNQPPVIVDSQAPSICTVTWLVADTASNDVFAARMRIEPTETDAPVAQRLPCPLTIAPRVADRALDACISRAADPKTCVFADMARGFEREPALPNSAENASRCRSDEASFLGVACWRSGTLAICNVGCGNAAAEAVAKAKARCEDKQQRSCPITESVPIEGP